MRKTWVQSLDWEIPGRRERLLTAGFWSGESHGLQSMGSQRLSDFHFTTKLPYKWIGGMECYQQFLTLTYYGGEHDRCLWRKFIQVFKVWRKKRCVPGFLCCLHSTEGPSRSPLGQPPQLSHIYWMLVTGHPLYRTVAGRQIPDSFTIIRIQNSDYLAFILQAWL